MLRPDLDLQRPRLPVVGTRSWIVQASSRRPAADAGAGDRGSQRLCIEELRREVNDVTMPERHSTHDGCTDNRADRSSLMRRCIPLVELRLRRKGEPMTIVWQRNASPERAARMREAFAAAVGRNHVVDR